MNIKRLDYKFTAETSFRLALIKTINETITVDFTHYS